MKRRELEHTLRRAAHIAGESEFFVIGSQAVHAYSRRLPAETLLSQECDLYPKNRPETASLLDAQLGRASSFARRHGFYADVVTPEIASLPIGWKRRLKPLRVGRLTAWCLDVHDLIVSKLAAARLKDLEFVGALLEMTLANHRTVRRRIDHFPIERDRSRLRARLRSILDDLRHA